MVALVTGAIGILTALVIVYLVRKDHLHVHHGLWWWSVAIGFALLGFFPSLFDQIAAKIGIAYPPVLALTLGLALLVIKVLQMDIERSKNAAKLQRLVQRIGMLEADLQEHQAGNQRGKHSAHPNITSESEAAEPDEAQLG